MPQRGLHILLALALLLFSWAELEHNTDLDAHHGGESCAVCVFASPLGHGVTPVASLPPAPSTHTIARQVQRKTGILPATYRHTLGQRGPPLHS